MIISVISFIIAILMLLTITFPIVLPTTLPEWNAAILKHKEIIMIIVSLVSLSATLFLSYELVNQSKKSNNRANYQTERQIRVDLFKVRNEFNVSVNMINANLKRYIEYSSSINSNFVRHGRDTNVGLIIFHDIMTEFSKIGNKAGLFTEKNSNVINNYVEDIKEITGMTMTIAEHNEDFNRCEQEKGNAKEYWKEFMKENLERLLSKAKLVVSKYENINIDLEKEINIWIKSEEFK